MRRRDVLIGAVAGMAFAGCANRMGLLDVPGMPVTDYDWRNPPHYGLKAHFSAPEIIDRIDIHSGGQRQNYIRVRSENGAEGIVSGNSRLTSLMSSMDALVIPFFLGRDARNLETLIDEVYRWDRNYKYAGMALWNCVSFIECAILDMLGKVAGKPVHALFGPQLRSEVPIYQSSLKRDPNLTPDQLLDEVEADMEDSGAKAVKLKIGARMSRNADLYEGYSEGLIRRARERLGDDVALYFDANGSYDAVNAIRTGRLMEEVGAGFYEEPCEWQDYAATKQAAQALDLTVAGGEQDTSMAQFDYMLRSGILDMIQPDTMYQGGFIRLLRMGEIARSHGTLITPHSPRHDPSQMYMLHFAAICPNLGEHQEHRANVNVLPLSSSPHQAKNGVVPVPSEPGWGAEFDPAIWTTVPRVAGGML